MDIFQFMSESPFLSFFLGYFAFECVRQIGCRLVRCINVAVRGWPPEHLDADGDWKPEPKKD